MKGISAQRSGVFAARFLGGPVGNSYVSLNRSAALLILLSLLLASPRAGETRIPSSDSPRLEYTIVVTGGELLRGVYADTHTHFLTRTLEPLGGRCVGSLSIDDNRADLLRALEFARQRAPLTIVTGGLGPTPNDITREVLSEFTDVPLEESPELLASLGRRFGADAEGLRANMRRQTRVPTSGSFFPNSHGTAAGLVFETPDKVLVALPGPPRELRPMVVGQLLPYLRDRYGVRALGAALTLRFVGVGQSRIDQVIKEKLALPEEVIVTSLFAGRRVDFTFTVPGTGGEEVERLRRLTAGLHDHLGAYLYADDGSTLEEVVARQLRGRGRRLVVAEIATRGRLATDLAEAEGQNPLLAGVYVANDLPALWRMLSDEPERLPDPPDRLTKQIALLARTRTGADLAILLGDIGTDSEDGRRVPITLFVADREPSTIHLPVSNATAISIDDLVTRALDAIRRELTNIAE